MKNIDRKINFQKSAGEEHPKRLFIVISQFVVESFPVPVRTAGKSKRKPIVQEAWSRKPPTLTRRVNP
jgi:hypothetical protein